MHKHMHVIRHHAPGENLALLMVEEQESLFRGLRDVAIPQRAGTQRAIEIFFELAAFFSRVLEREQMLPFISTFRRQRIG